MFTGIIQAVGSVIRLQPEGRGARLQIRAPRPLLAPLGLGASIAVNGCCLTIVAKSSTRFAADLAEETLARTSLGAFTAATRVNLEAPTPAGAPLSGHILQGHIEATATLLELKKIDARSGYWLRLRAPRPLLPHIVAKGSLAVDGISLTVAAIHGDELGFAILPFTHSHTHLRTLQPGAALNLETDAITRQRAQHQALAPPSISLAEWRRQGF